MTCFGGLKPKKIEDKQVPGMLLQKTAEVPSIRRLRPHPAGSKPWVLDSGTGSKPHPGRRMRKAGKMSWFRYRDSWQLL